jgi:mRNA-degrading endonuclease YafQ of YafQ-DinJ toxin-antitoxin module
VRNAREGEFWRADAAEAVGNAGLDFDLIGKTRAVLEGRRVAEGWRHDHALGPPLRGWRSIRVSKDGAFILIYSVAAGRVLLETIGRHDETYLRLAERKGLAEHPAFPRWLMRVTGKPPA